MNRQAERGTARYAPIHAERVAAARRPTAQIDLQIETEREELTVFSHHYHLESNRMSRAEARRSRHLHSASISRPPRRPVRRVVGRLMMDVGSRLAADPLSDRARSR